MIWTVLTVVPESHTPPLPRQEKAVGIKEIGCSACIIRSKELELCIMHRRERVWSARTVEAPDEEVNVVQSSQSERSDQVGDSIRTEEPVEVPEGSVELSSV